MKLGIMRDNRYLEHKTGLTHPESPMRLKAVYEMLAHEFDDQFTHIQPELASLEMLEMAHSPKYVEMVLRTAQLSHVHLAPDTPSGVSSYLPAYLAAGGCVKGVKSLLNGELEALFALVRPPGHHALLDRAGGFCIFNNLGVAAKYALKKLNMKRILIVDWDIHHGNALQELFYEDDRVMYISTHYLAAFPYTGHWEETGEGKGEGYSLNLPVPKDFNDEEAIYIYREVLKSVMRNYEPELVMVAAGFDAHRQDPLGMGLMTEKGFGELARICALLGPLSLGAPLLLALEGGYRPRAVAASVREVLKSLLSAHQPREDYRIYSPRAAKIVARAREVHAPFKIWT